MLLPKSPENEEIEYKEEIEDVINKNKFGSHYDSLISRDWNHNNNHHVEVEEDEYIQNEDDEELTDLEAGVPIINTNKNNDNIIKSETNHYSSIISIFYKGTSIGFLLAGALIFVYSNSNEIIKEKIMHKIYGDNKIQNHDNNIIPYYNHHQRQTLSEANGVVVSYNADGTPIEVDPKMYDSFVINKDEGNSWYLKRKDGIHAFQSKPQSQVQIRGVALWEHYPDIDAETEVNKSVWQVKQSHLDAINQERKSNGLTGQVKIITIDRVAHKLILMDDNEVNILNKDFQIDVRFFTKVAAPGWVMPAHPKS